MYVKIPDAIMVPGAKERNRLFKVLIKMKADKTGGYRYLLSHSDYPRTHNLINYEYSLGWKVEYVDEDFTIPDGKFVHYAYWLSSQYALPEYADSNKGAKTYLKR